jgi:hypothetical protein
MVLEKVYTQKQLYKEIRYAIRLMVERTYRDGPIFDSLEEDQKWIDKTVRSVFYEYKRNRKLGY